MMTPLMPDFSTMLPDEVLVWVHVPEADQLTHEEAVKVARERHWNAQLELEADISTLRIEEAAKLARESQAAFLLDQHDRETRERQILRELGY